MNGMRRHRSWVKEYQKDEKLVIMTDCIFHSANLFLSLSGITLAGCKEKITMEQLQETEREPVSSVSENANSSANAGNNNIDENGVYSGRSTLQSGQEFENDKYKDHSKDDNTITASGVDDLQSNSEGAAGTDRAGTFERKAFGDTELNKGLEAQARDAEGA